MTFEVQGKVYEIFPTQQVSERFKKREFVLEIPDGSYMQYIKFQLNQDRVSLIDAYKIGDQVNVHFNLSGKPFTDRNNVVQYYNNLTVWRIEGGAGKAQTEQAAAPRSTSSNTVQEANDAFSNFANDDKDLPF